MLDRDKIVRDHTMGKGNDILDTLADRTKMTHLAGCMECTMANIVVDEEDFYAFEKFLKAIDLKGGCHL